MPLVAMLLATLPAAAYDYDFEDNGMYYLIISDDDLTCAVAPGNKAYSGNVVIPATATFEGATYKVTAIAANAFKDCKRLKSIDLGNVTEIGDSGFQGCSSLTVIDLKNVTKLGNFAFKECTGLESVNLRNITELRSTFFGCSNLKNVEGSENLIHLYFCCGYYSNGVWYDSNYPQGPFENCSSLTTLSLPNVVSLERNSFSGSSVTSLILPNCTTICEDEDPASLWCNYDVFPSIQMEELALPKLKGYPGTSSMQRVNTSKLVLGAEAIIFTTCRDKTFCAFGPWSTSIKEVIFLSTEPKSDQVGADLFQNSDVYVPKGSATAYKAYKAEKPNCFKNVYEFDPEVKMSENAVTIRLDGRYQLSAMALPYYDSTNIQWESSNPSIADVSSKGLVFGFSEGNATITAKYGNATATCVVKVSKTESVEDVKVDAATEYDVYNMQGIMVRSKCDKADIYDLPGGIYILVSPQGRTKVRI